jgi:hypothetical protein
MSKAIPIRDILGGEIGPQDDAVVVKHVVKNLGQPNFYLLWRLQITSPSTQ